MSRRLREILPTVGSVQVSHLEVDTRGDEIVIEYTKMYDAPPITYKMLRDLAEFYGTEKINVDQDISREGCETCDYGSAYGHTIVVTGATINQDAKP